MSMKITNRIATEIASHEAIVRQAYKDSVGVWTWGIGLTRASGIDVERFIGKPQPLEDVMRAFMKALEKYADDVREAFRGTSLTEEQFGAALSFHYNTGAIKRATWVKQFKNGNIEAAKRSFMNWSKPPEIIPRRRKERDLFFDRKWSNRGTIPEITRVTAKHTPDWSSRKNIDAEQCFGSKTGAEILDEIHGAKQPASFIERLLAALSKLIKGASK